MDSYKVYLTKNHEVAAIIAKAHSAGKDNIISVSCGAIFDNNGEIPDIFKHCGYAQCTIKSKTLDGKQPTYEIIFA